MRKEVRTLLLAVVLVGLIIVAPTAIASLFSRASNGGPTSFRGRSTRQAVEAEAAPEMIRRGSAPRTGRYGILRVLRSKSQF